MPSDRVVEHLDREKYRQPLAQHLAPSWHFEQFQFWLFTVIVLCKNQSCPSRQSLAVSCIGRRLFEKIPSSSCRRLRALAPVCPCKVAKGNGTGGCRRIGRWPAGD